MFFLIVNIKKNYIKKHDSCTVISAGHVSECVEHSEDVTDAIYDLQITTKS